MNRTRKINLNSFLSLRKKAEHAIKRASTTINNNENIKIYKLLHELEVHQVELEVQNDELQRTLLNLNNTQNKYHSLYNLSPVGYLTIDESRLIFEVNLACAELLGYECKKLMKKRFSSFIHKDWHSIFYKHYEKALTTKIKQACELQMIKKDGSSFHAHLESIVFQDSINNSIQLRMVIIDLTDRMLAERALQNSEQKFRSFIENTNDWVWEIDTSGLIRYSNPSILFILGYHANKLLNKNRLNFVYSEDREHILEIFTESILQQRGWNNKVSRWCHKDGSIRYLESNATPIIDDAGQIQGFRGISRDITVRIKNEEQISQYELALNKAARTQSMGELASALAHELTQPLAIINNFTAGCIYRLESTNFDSNEILEIMRRVEKQTIRAGETIHRMKDFMRQGKLYYEDVNLNDLISRTVDILKKEIYPDILKLYIELPKHPVHIKGDSIQLGLVILNLMRNSVEAMTNLTDINKQEIIIRLKKLPKNRIIVSVTDTGHGVPDNDAEKIFLPYYTTKPDNLGIGLAVARTIVEAHNGQLSVKKNHKEGACFIMRLPCTLQNR
jgi:PAS domain S-box-containing protein